MPDLLDVAAIPSRTQSRNRPRLKLNEAKALELAQLGVSKADIAQHQGVDRKVIWRFLDDHLHVRQRLQRWKAHRADLLAALQADCYDVQQKILESIQKDGVIATLKTSEKTGLLMALNATAGTMFDKERLERGQSTSNQSIITSMLNSTVKALYQPVPAVPVRAHKPRKQRNKQPEHEQ